MQKWVFMMMIKKLNTLLKKKWFPLRKSELKNSNESYSFMHHEEDQHKKITVPIL